MECRGRAHIRPTAAHGWIGCRSAGTEIGTGQARVEDVIEAGLPREIPDGVGEGNFVDHDAREDFFNCVAYQSAYEKSHGCGRAPEVDRSSFHIV
jgi:hypothetical protein